jgi:hypothetical protein
MVKGSILRMLLIGHGSNLCLQLIGRGNYFVPEWGVSVLLVDWQLRASFMLKKIHWNHHNVEGRDPLKYVENHL